MTEPTELTAATLWTEVTSRLKAALNDATYRTWFGEAEGREISEKRFVIAVPNNFTREWIEGHFVGLIDAALRDATGHEREVVVVVDEELPVAPAPAKTATPVSPQLRVDVAGMVYL